MTENDPKDPKTSSESSAVAAEPVPPASADSAKAEAEPKAPVEVKAEAKPAAEPEAKAAAEPKLEPKPASVKPVSAPRRVATPAARARLTYGKDATASDAATAKSALKPRRLLAEYDTTADVVHAAETLRDAGYKSFEAHSPFPIHGMDAAMGLPDSRLGWIVLVCGLTGVTSAWVMMYWMNGVDYPLIIGGKPPDALPSMVPIMFELTVLLSSFGAVLGMFGLNRLPQHHDVLFHSDRFAAFSNDKFFISVESEDPKFDVVKTQALLEKTKPEAIEVIETLEVER